MLAGCLLTAQGWGYSGLMVSAQSMRLLLNVDKQYANLVTLL